MHLMCFRGSQRAENVIIDLELHLVTFAHQVFFVCVCFLNPLLRTDTLHTGDKGVIEQDTVAVSQFRVCLL